MEAARDAYSHINPDSPWRWVPVVAGPLAFVALGIAMEAKGISTLAIAAWTVIAAVFALKVVAGFKFGPVDAYSIAVQHARASGGVRVRSHSTLATTMLVVGSAMVLAWCVVRVVVDHERPERTLVESIVRSIGFVWTGIMLAINGWYHPWDLKVVEGGPSTEIAG